MSDDRPLYETSDAGLDDLEKLGYNAVPHQVEAPKQTSEGSSEDQQANNQDSSNQQGNNKEK